MGGALCAIWVGKEPQSGIVLPAQSFLEFGSFLGVKDIGDQPAPETSLHFPTVTLETFPGSNVVSIGVSGRVERRKRDPSSGAGSLPFAEILPNHFHFVVQARTFLVPP